MNKAIKISLLFLIILFMCSSICLANDVAPISSDDKNVESTSEPPSNELSITNKDIYLFSSDDIIMSELVNGNTFIIGNNVTVTGQIAGDLFVIAQNLTIESSSAVYNNIFAMADQITLKGEVNDVYAIASNFILDSSAYIGRDLNLFAKDVTLNGIIMKDAYISSDSINFNSENTAYSIRGNLYFSSSNQVSIPEGAVMGETKLTKIEKNVETIEYIIYEHIISFANVMLLAAAVILLSTFVTPNFATKATYCMFKKPFSTVGIGILSFIFVPVLCIVALFTGILVYFSFALLALYALVLSITISILGIAVGNYIANKFKNKTKSKSILLSLASVVCLWLLQLIPYVGSYISLFVLVFGIGIFVFSFFVKLKNEELETTSEDK